MSLDDNTNPNNACCGTVQGMCCSSQVMPQRQILVKT